MTKSFVKKDGSGFVPMAGYEETSKTGEVFMKRLIALAVFLAGALVASARVDWIPTSLVEGINYAKAEINEITVGLGVPTTGGGTYVEIDLQNRISRSGTNIWGSTNTWNIETVASDKLWEYLNYFLTNSNGYNSHNTPPKEGQVYFTGVSWMAWYNNAGANDVYGVHGLIQAVAFSPEFTLSKVDGKFVIPPEAFSLTPNWLRNTIGIPAISSHVRWVDYVSHEPGYDDLIELTRNGLNPTCPGSAATNGFIHFQAGWVLNEADWIISPTAEQRKPSPGTYLTFTIWYDEGRTDGTEWKWAEGEKGVIKREIFPPSPTLSIAPFSGGLKVTLAGIAGRVYALENVPSLEIIPTNRLKKSEVGTAMANGAGVAEWIVKPTNASGFFRARLLD